MAGFESTLDELWTKAAYDGIPSRSRISRSASRAASNRRLASGERGLVLDAGLNVLYTAHWYAHSVVPAQDVDGQLESTTLHGPLCMNIDTLRRSVWLPPMEVGDRVVIRPVGAYNVTQWMQFSQLRPAVVMIGEDGDVSLIRRAETFADVKGPECLPDRYKPDLQMERDGE